MRNKRIGKRTMKMQNSPTIISTASIVGPKEGKGPLKDKFDVILSDDLYGEKTWELAESKMIQTALETTRGYRILIWWRFNQSNIPGIICSKGIGHSVLWNIWCLFNNGTWNVFKFYCGRRRFCGLCS